MTKGVKNQFYELAAELAEEYGNPASLGMWMKDLSWLKKEGLDADEVIDAWRQLRSSEGIGGFSIPSATIRTVVTKGSPAYISQYREQFWKDMPPVYQSHSHTEWVRRNAKRLKKLGWQYNGWASENDADGVQRLSFEECEELGLMPK